MPRMFGPLVALAYSALGALAFAEAPPQFTVSSGYAVTGAGPASGDWSLSQSADLGLAARWGATLALDVRVAAPFDQSPLTGDQLIHQLELSANLGDQFVVTLGKQRLSWGSARLLPSVDSLEPTYDPAHPTAVLDGVAGAKLEWIPNEWLSFSGLALPVSRALDTKVALRADALVTDADLSFGAVRSVEAGTNHWALYGAAARFFDRFGLYAEGQIRDTRARRWAYQTASLSDSSAWTPQATVGAQFDQPLWFDGTLRTVVEYRYNGEGFNGTEADTFGQALSVSDANGSSRGWIPQALWSGGVGRFSRHYGALSLSGLPLTQRLTLGGFAVVGLDTGFTLVRSNLDLRIDDHLALSLEETEVTQLSSPASELTLLAFRHQVRLAIQGQF